ncbi:MAG: MMPL family transporter, partial [Thermoguttaceae bacterium]
RLELINLISEKLKSELSEEVGGTLSVALFAPDATELTSRRGAAYRTVATVVGKTVDENRDALRDYLTVEGNPNLDELQEYASNQAEIQRADFDRRVAEFNAELAKDENVASRNLNYDSFVADVDHEFEQDEFLAPYFAKYQALEAFQTETEKKERGVELLETEREYLNEQDVVDLKTLLEQTKMTHTFRKIAPDDVEVLKGIGESWQRERGIELWRISIRVWSLKKDIDYSAFIENVKNVVEPVLAEESIQLTTSLAIAGQIAEGSDEETIEADAAQTKLNQAHEYVASRLAEEEGSAKKKDSKDEKTLLREFVLSDLSDSERAELQNSMGESHTADWIYPAGFSAKYTGMVPLVYTTQHELIKGLTSSLLTAFILIMLVFVFLLRSIPAGFIAMIPNIFPVVTVFGFMSWMGVLVDVGTMMTASVALGVAVDNTMHYLTWFSESLAQGMEPKQAALNAYRRCATAMTQSTLIAGLGLFSFAFSTFVPTERFGIMMLAILLTAAFGDLIFLPALLTCKPFGRFFVNRRLGIKSQRGDVNDRVAAE